MPPYGEVIGDPIDHSKSPAIHDFWLRALAIDGHFHATRVPPEGLSDYFGPRRGDPDWRGCNVTAPHKQAVIPHLDEVGAEAKRIGAVNCIQRAGDRLVGLNTDVDGIAEALAGVDLKGAKLTVIGGGGGARSAAAHAAAHGARTVTVLVRDPARGAAMIGLGTTATTLEIQPFERAEAALADAAAVVNATPLGMAHAAPMPAALLAALGKAAPGAIALDMIYAPLDTPFLQAAGAAGLAPVDGLAMLVGQARKAFEIFFGVTPPRDQDEALRQRLVNF